MPATFLLAVLSAVRWVMAVEQASVTPEQGSVNGAGKFTPAAESGNARPSLTDPVRQALGVEPLGEGKFKLGAVTFDQTARTITIPAQVNMREGAVEYALVTEEGKKHEAIFSTSARAEHVHLACLLLGLREAKIAGADGTAESVAAENAVELEVTWETNGPEKRVSLAECVALAKDSPGQASGQTLAAGAWFYNGSRLDAAGFAAAREGSIVSLIRDGAALMNNPREGRDNDQLHVAHTALLPNVGVPVRIVIKLPPAGK